jgi:hypothetical protein
MQPTNLASASPPCIFLDKILKTKEIGPDFIDKILITKDFLKKEIAPRLRRGYLHLSYLTIAGLMERIGRYKPLKIN